jgi:hypothetical protein
MLLKSNSCGVTCMASVSGKSGKNLVAGSSVAGYFANGEDARRAIDALLDEGFDIREIGAAFHSRVRRDSMLALEEEPTRRMSKSDDSMAGVASGSSGVTPSGLSTGGGTAIAGSHKPGPITGAEIPSGLPTNIPSELPTDAEVRVTKSKKGPVMAAQTSSVSKEDERSWRERLETVFGRQSTMGSMAASRKFGTGEGHLEGIADYAYSSSAFEQSFTRMGIPPEHARRVAQELQRGGAVVTVKAGGRAAEAESVLLRNHGIIRYETPAARREPSRDMGHTGGRMEIFGEVHRVYPNYVPQGKQIARNAS